MAVTLADLQERYPLWEVKEENNQYAGKVFAVRVGKVTKYMGQTTERLPELDREYQTFAKTKETLD